jgi:hypothetical protein
VLCTCLAALVAAEPAMAGDTGGARYVAPPPPAKRAKIVNGIAIPPAGAPRRVKRVIAAANRIIEKPYVYGGGHQIYKKSVTTSQIALASGYDCSGAVSFALRGGGLIRSPLDSSSFMSWARRGKGRWITVYTNPGHAYLVVAGLRFDTSGGDRVSQEERQTGTGPRWRKYSRSPRGFTPRHPKKL